MVLFILFFTFVSLNSTLFSIETVSILSGHGLNHQNSTNTQSKTLIQKKNIKIKSFNPFNRQNKDDTTGLNSLRTNSSVLSQSTPFISNRTLCQVTNNNTRESSSSESSLSTSTPSNSPIKPDSRRKLTSIPASTSSNSRIGIRPPLVNKEIINNNFKNQLVNITNDLSNTKVYDKVQFIENIFFKNEKTLLDPIRMLPSNNKSFSFFLLKFRKFNFNFFFFEFHPVLRTEIVRSISDYQLNWTC
jgi:hypothetical protein